MAHYKARITQSQFLKACDMLRNNAEEFLRDKPGLVKAAERLGQLCGFAIADSSMTTIK